MMSVPSCRSTAGQKRAEVSLVWALLGAASWLQCNLVGGAGNPFSATNTAPIGATFQPLLPRLSTFVQPNISFGPNNVSLGNTTFRWVGARHCHESMFA